MSFLDLEEVDTRLQLLDQALDAGDYRGARVRLFGLLHGLALAAEQDDEPWRAVWIGPVQRRALPLYSLLVKKLRRKLRACERRARIQTNSSSGQSDLRRLMKRQRETVSQALYAGDRDDRQLSVRELSRMARDPLVLECLDEARQLLEGHLRTLDRVEQKRLDATHRKHQQEVARLREQAKQVDELRGRTKTLQGQVRASTKRARSLEAQLDRQKAWLDEKEEALKSSRGAREKLRLEMETERAERRRHEERLAKLEQRAAEQNRRQRQALEETENRLSHTKRARSGEREAFEEERDLLRERLAEREATIAQLRQRVSVRAQDRQDRIDLILGLMHEEEELLREEEVVPAHEEYGVLIAWIWEEIRERTGLEFHDLQLFEEELAQLLDQPAQIASLLGHREAIAAFNAYQESEISPIEDLVEAAGYGQASRELLILAFAEHWPDWRRQHQARVRDLFLRFQSGTLPSQARLTAWFQERGVDPVVLTARTFAASLDDDPAMVQEFLREPTVQPEPVVTENESAELLPGYQSHEVSPSETEESPFGV